METDSNQQVEKKSVNKGQAGTCNTPVILVCINNNSGIVITNDFLYAIFSPYGKVLRILIFEKVKIWKAFIEYSTVESAIEAKKHLNNFLLLNDGTRISIYNSNLETVKFQSNNTGGVDYTLLENKNSSELKDAPRMPEDPYAALSQFHSAIDNINNVNYAQEQNKQLLLNHNSYNEIDFHQQEIPRKESQGSSKNEDLSRFPENPAEHKEKYQNEEEEKERREDKEDEDFIPFLQSGFTNAKAQVTHVHSVPAQLYRDNPQLQQQQQQPKLQNNPQPENSLPPGLMIPQFGHHTQNQGLPVQSGNPRLVRNAMSMNFIPLSDPSKQTPTLTRNPITGEMMNPQSIGAPLTQLPQFGSMNNLTMPKTPTYGQTPVPIHDISQYAQPIQKRPQLNARFLSQPELPLMGMNRSPVNQQGIPGIDPLMMNRDPNMLMMNQGGIPQQQAVGGMDYNNFSNMNRSTLSQLHTNLAMLLGKGDENKKSRVLYVKGLENKDIKVHMLYNIFSNFGNILKILYIPTKSSALLEFENSEYSTICMDYLNNISFMGKPLRIYYSKYSIINLRNKKGEEPGEETFIGNQKTFRFKNNKNISINPPSATLHLSNLVKEACTDDTIRTHFAPYGRIEALKFIFGDNNKNMCLLRLASIEESLNAMAYLHDSDLNGRKVQISFTRSRI